MEGPQFSSYEIDDDENEDNYDDEMMITTCRYFCRPINKQQARATVMKQDSLAHLFILLNWTLLLWLLWKLIYVYM